MSNNNKTMFQANFIPQGWECPKCKRVYAPTMMQCSHCPEHNQGITGSGTTLTTVGSRTTYITHNFQSDKKSSSKTKCQICGLEKWQHPTITNT